MERLFLSVGMSLTLPPLWRFCLFKPLANDLIMNRKSKPVNTQYSLMNRSSCSGFTLIEMAIVLMVIGLMLGFSFKGQGQIDNPKAHRLEDDFRNITTYVNEYQGQFKTLPGDDPIIGSSRSHLNDAIACDAAITGKCITGNGVIEGRWNAIPTAS